MAWRERRPDGTWRGVYRTLDGRKKSKAGFAYEGAALAWADAAELVELGGSAARNPNTVTFGEYAKRWVARRTGIAPSSIEKYRSAVAGIVDHVPFSGRPINAVTAAEVEAWCAAMDADGSGVGVPTRNYRVKVLRMIFSQARVIDKIRDDAGVIIDDPTATIRAARQRSGKRQRLFLRDPEVDAMLAAAVRLDSTGTDNLMSLLGVDAGLRWCESAALAVDDIHLDDVEVPHLWIWRSVVKSTGRIQETTKNGEPRMVPVDPEGRLAEALRQRADDVLLLNGPGALLLPRSLTDAGPLAYSTCMDRFTAIVKASGIVRQPVGWHDYRHTFGSNLNKQRVDIAIIAKVLGHSQLEVTRRYVHASEVDVQHAEVTRALRAGRAA